MSETFIIVTHNAIGTVYSFIRGFLSIEEAKNYRSRWGHTGVGFNSPIIKAEDELKIKAINNRWSDEAIKLYVG